MPHRPSCSRRNLLATGLAAAALGGCRALPGPPEAPVTGGADGADRALGRLSYRPGETASPSGPGRPGTHELPADGGRPAVVHVPAGGGPVRLVVLLHGAGGEPRRTLELLRPFADQARLLLLAPASQGQTWDVLHGGFGPDVRTLDALLRRVADEHALAGHTIAGFSDGASYALSLGVTNGDVFDSVVAFSPGFVAAQVRHGRPRCFVSHGTADRVLPIDVCSRRLVPALERQGHDVTYQEFAGGHEVPQEVRRAAVDWLGGV